jgi:hypothetical protein
MVRNMSKKSSLDTYALFYERIDAAKNDSVNDLRKKNSYENPSSLKDDDISKLGQDLQSPIHSSDKSDPIQS